jgi:DNA-binding IclR family transcriptional regulator
VHLAQLIDHEVTYIDKVEGRDRVRMYSRIGKQVATHASGIGKAILAFVEEPLQSEVIAGLELTRHTKTTITSPERFREELDLIRTRGWATDDGEFEDYIACVAAPVRGSDGRVRAGVSITTLQALASVTQLERLVPDLLKTADSISAECGWAAP